MNYVFRHHKAKKQTETPAAHAPALQTQPTALAERHTTEKTAAVDAHEQVRRQKR